jgi:hypothetical protein
MHTTLDTSTRAARENVAATAASVTVTTAGKRFPFTVLIFIVNVTALDLGRKIFLEQVRTVILRYAQQSVDSAKQDNPPEDDEDDTDDSDDSNDSDQDNQDLHEDEEDEEDDEDEEDEETPPRLIIREYKFGLEEFNLLVEKIPNQIDDYILKLDLWDGYLCVRTVPGDPHGTATGVLVQQMFFWCKDPNNQTVAGMPLKVPMDASMFFACVR